MDKNAASAPAFWRDVWGILKACGVLTPKVAACLAAYYVLTPFGALIDGLSWLLLLRIFAAPAPGGDQDALLGSVIGWLRLPSSGLTLLAVVAGLFLVKAAIAVSLSVLQR